MTAESWLPCVSEALRCMTAMSSRSCPEPHVGMEGSRTMAPRPRELTPDRSARHLFGAKMRAYRERAAMSLEGLSDVVNISRSHLARIETAEVLPPPSLAPMLDAAFGKDGIF